jgi:hypothetical protein
MELILAAVMTVLFGALCPIPLCVAQNSARITGTVLDERGAVIPKAEVILRQAAQQTSKILADAFGAFAFSVQPGEYSLDVSSRGFKTLTIRNITIHGGESKVLPPISLQVASIGSCADDFQLPTFAVERLASKRGEITGEIVNTKGELVKGVAVTVSLSVGRRSNIRTTTDESGKFTLTALRPGTYSLTASLSGHADFVVQAIAVARSQRTSITPALQMDECPPGVACKPVYKLRVPVLCL